MAFSAGEVEAIFKMRDDLTKQVKRVKGSLRDAGKAAKDAGRAFETAGTKIQSAGSAMLPFSAALAAASGAAFKFGKDFDASMTRIVTLVGIGEETVDGFRQQVLDLAGATARAPQELADALFIVTSAGARGAEAMDILTVAAKASAVGLGDTGEIARSITAAIQAYGSENLSASQAANVLFKTVREGNLNAEDLSGSLGRVIGIAAQVGVTFASVGGTIATYTRLGVSAEEATTGLRAILTSLIKPGTDAKKALAEVGLSAAGLRRQIREEGLAKTLVDLANQFRGNEEALARVVPNVRALSTILGVAGTQSEAFLAIEKSIATETDALGAGFERTAQTIDFKWNKALSDMQAIAIRAFETFKAEFAGAVEILQKGIGVFNQLLDVFENMSPAGKKVTAAIVGIGIAAGPALIALGSAVRVVGFALQGLGVSAGTAGIGIGGLKAAVVSLGPALAIAAAAFAVFKFAEWTGAVAEIRAQIEKWTLRLQGLTNAEIAAFQANRSFSEGLAGTIQPAAALSAQLSTIGLAGNMTELQFVFDNFNRTGTITQDSMRQIAAKALELKAKGEDLSPTMQKLVDQLGTMDEAAKQAAVGLDTNTTAAVDAAQAAAELEKAEEDLAQAFAAFGFTTVPAVNKELALLAEVEKRATDQGASARTVALQLKDAYEELQIAADASGLEIEGLNEAIARNTAAATLNFPAIKQLSLESGVLANSVLKSAAELEGVTGEMQANWQAAGDLAGAYETLGIKTQASLTQTREEAQAAFDLISTSASATKDDVARATKALADAVKAETGRAGTEGSRAFTLMNESIQGSFAQMLSGSKSFADGFSDIWNSLKTGFLGGLTDMLGGFLGKFIPGMSQGFASLTGTASTALGDGGGVSGIFSGVFGGGGKLGGIMSSFGPMAGGLLTSGLSLLAPLALKALAPLGKAILGGLKKIGGFFKQIFGGPSEEEIAGRGVSDQFKAWAAEAKTAADEIQIARLVSEGWARDLATQVVVVTAQYAEVGLSAAEAQADVKATWDAIKEGPEAVTAAIEAIQGKLEDVGTTASESAGAATEAIVTMQEAVVATGERTTEAGAVMQQSIMDVAESMREVGTVTAEQSALMANSSQEATDVFVAGTTRIEDGLGLVARSSEIVLEGIDVLRSGAESDFAEIRGGIQDTSVVSDELLSRIRTLADLRVQIPVSFDVGDLNLPELPGGINIESFQGGGIVKRPTLAVLGEGGPEAVVPLGGGGGGGDGAMGGTEITFNITTLDADSFDRIITRKIAPMLVKKLRGNTGRFRTDVRDAINVPEEKT